MRSCSVDGVTKSYLFSQQVNPLRQAECCYFSTSKFLRYQTFSILAAVYVCPWPIHHSIVKMFRKLRPMFLCTWPWRCWNMGRNWVDIISSHAQSWALGWRRLTGELIGVEFNLSPQITLHLGLIVTLKCNAATLTSFKTFSCITKYCEIASTNKLEKTHWLVYSFYLISVKFVLYVLVNLPVLVSCLGVPCKVLRC